MAMTTCRKTKALFKARRTQMAKSSSSFLRKPAMAAAESMKKQGSTSSLPQGNYAIECVDVPVQEPEPQKKLSRPLQPRAPQFKKVTAASNSTILQKSKAASPDQVVSSSAPLKLKVTMRGIPVSEYSKTPLKSALECSKKKQSAETSTKLKAAAAPQEPAMVNLNNQEQPKKPSTTPPLRAQAPQFKRPPKRVTAATLPTAPVDEKMEREKDREEARKQLSKVEKSVEFEEDKMEAVEELLRLCGEGFHVDHIYSGRPLRRLINLRLKN